MQDNPKKKNDDPVGNPVGNPLGKPAESPPEGPPFFKKWAGMYSLVIVNLIFLILLFYLLTAHYA